MNTCARCRKQAEHVVACYWPPHPGICGPCATAVAELLDREDRWPDAPWTDAELRLVNYTPDNVRPSTTESTRVGGRGQAGAHAHPSAPNRSPDLPGKKGFG